MKKAIIVFLCAVLVIIIGVFWVNNYMHQLDMLQYEARQICDDYVSQAHKCKLVGEDGGLFDLIIYTFDAGENRIYFIPRVNPIFNAKSKFFKEDFKIQRCEIDGKFDSKNCRTVN